VSEVRGAASAPVPAVRQGFKDAWVHFWFTPVDPVGLHCVRVLAGLLFLYWLLPFAGHADGLFGLSGWFDRQAYGGLSQLPEAARPPLGWSILYLFPNSPGAVTAIYWASVAILVLFTVGLWPRVTAVLTWVVVASFTANPAIGFDADALLQLFAFYLMIGYLLLGQRDPEQSLAARLLGPSSALFFGPCGDRTAQPSAGANVALRLLQVHFAAVLVVSALAKMQSGDWWSGCAFWYPLNPPLQTTMEAARSHAAHATAYLFVLSLTQYLLWGWELTFPLFAWRPRWRVLLLGGAAAWWLVWAYVMGLPLFGPAFFVAALCFLTPAEWRRVLARVPRIPGLQGLARWLPTATPATAGTGAQRLEAVPVAAGRSR